MNPSQWQALYDPDQRIHIQFPNMRREVTPQVVRHVDLSSGGEGMIAYSWLDESSADAAIREQVAYFQRLGQDFEWKVYDYDRPADLKTRLERQGFVSEELEVILGLDLNAAPEVLRQPVRQDVRRITDPRQLADVQAVQEGVWGEDGSWVFEVLGSVLRDDPGRMSVYVAYVDGQPASSAWVDFPPDNAFASLWGGSTLPQFRQRGLFTALLAARAQEAIARRVRYLTVDAMPMSRPILEKLGFERIAESYPCKWKHKP